MDNNPNEHGVSPGPSPNFSALGAFKLKDFPLLRRQGNRCFLIPA